jgi:hypothetical protein
VCFVVAGVYDAGGVIERGHDGLEVPKLGEGAVAAA